jgi:hypothetical protein
MGILSSILGGAISPIIDSATGLAKVFVGDKSERESNIHSEQESAFDVLQAEASAQRRENRTWFDSAIDGLNRLPRPLGFFAVLGILVWCPVDPVSFANAMVSYQLVPEWLALIVGQVFLMFYGGRLLNDWKMKAADPKVTASVLAQLKANKQEQSLPSPQKSAVSQVSVEPLAAARPIGEAEYKAQMHDASRPLSLDAIVEWNKRRSQG